MMGDERLLAIIDNRCGAKTEVWARVTGFFRPVAQFNTGKRQEYAERKPYNVSDE